MSDFVDQLNHGVLIADGAMGTAIHARDLPLDAFLELEGCNEILNVTRPDVIRDIHESFLAVGCDCIETNAFGASAVVLSEYGIADRVRELNLAAARIAREAADAWSTPAQPRYVLGNLGPGTKLPSLGHIEFETLASYYQEQALALGDGGVDALLVETCQDILQTKAALAGIDAACRDFGSRLPVLVQITMETTGTMLMGTEIGAALTAILGYDIQAFGLNCATGPEPMDEHLRYLQENSPLPISVMPNAGLPRMVDGQAYFPLQPSELAEWHYRFVTERGARLLGGCCGTTPEHLKQVVEKVRGAAPKERNVTFEPSVASLYQRVTVAQENSFLIVGERCNTTGSKRFRELLEAGDLDGMLQTAKEQVRHGAHVLDVCVDYVGRNGPEDMTNVIRRFATEVTVPLVIDSTELPVIEAALRLLGGKATINSVNLENGLERPARLFPLARRFNAAVVALTIDEEGMARTADRKVEIARRIYDLAVDDYGFDPHNLWFDCLTLPVSTGIAEDRRNAAETIEGVRRIKAACPGSFAILGVSNVSFGLTPAARHVLNSVFLHECQESGLDAAIVHAGRIMPLYRIDDDQRQAALDLLYDRSEVALTAFIKLFDGAEAQQHDGPREALPLEEELQRRIVEGDRVELAALLDQALEQYEPLAIINDHLLAGMQTVGELFGSGQMQLPFVLQSAEVMKSAVGYLEPHMAKSGGNRSKGTMVLATVKGDVHDIGKNLVDIILSNNGYSVVNLGIKQPVSTIIDAALEHGADAIGLSGLLVKSTLVMRDNLEELNRRGLDYFPVILGGAALTRSYVEGELRELYQGRVDYAQDAFEGLALMQQVCDPTARQQRRVQMRERYAAGGAAAPVAKPADEPAAATTEVRVETRRSEVATEVALPTPPFRGTRVHTEFDLRQVFSYVNPLALYGGQYRLRRRGTESREEWWARIGEDTVPQIEALQEQILKAGWFQPQAVWGYFPANADGNDLIVYGDDDRERGRFSFPRQADRRRLCIADYFRPVESGERDVLALQLVTLGDRVAPREQELFESDQYTDYLFLHGLAVETTEALAELVHQEVRRELGLAAADAPEVTGLFRQEYRGARYSFGYPACPELADQVLLCELLEPGRIGVSLSEEYQLVPEVSTSAVVTHHPEAAYFSVVERGGSTDTEP